MRPSRSCHDGARNTLIDAPGFDLKGWRLAAVVEKSGPRRITADQAVEQRENKAEAVFFLIDPLRAGAGLDGIYSAAREISEAELFKAAQKEVRLRLGRTDMKFTCINNVVRVSGCIAQSRTQKKRNSKHRRRYMRRNLDLDNCVNKQEAVIAAYAEELEENEKKIAEGAWATSLDLSRITHWYPILMRYCPNHSLTESLQRERNNMKRRKDFADFFFFDWD